MFCTIGYVIACWLSEKNFLIAICGRKLCIEKFGVFLLIRKSSYKESTNEARLCVLCSDFSIGDRELAWAKPGSVATKFVHAFSPGRTKYL